MLLTNSDVKAVLTSNFADQRMAAISFYINRLLSRVNYGGGIEQYRIKNTVTNTYITSFSDFITAISEDHLVADYVYATEAHSVDKTHPFQVTLTNLKVELTKFSNEDNYYTNMYGNKPEGYMLVLTVNYLSDADDVLPLKIINVKLV